MEGYRNWSKISVSGKPYFRYEVGVASSMFRLYDSGAERTYVIPRVDNLPNDSSLIGNSPNNQAQGLKEIAENDSLVFVNEQTGKELEFVVNAVEKTADSIFVRLRDGN